MAATARIDWISVDKETGLITGYISSVSLTSANTTTAANSAASPGGANFVKVTSLSGSLGAAVGAAATAAATNGITVTAGASEFLPVSGGGDRVSVIEVA